jgi:T5SS/PEP-CTERM-associated repeat protein
MKHVRYLWSGIVFLFITNLVWLTRAQGQFSSDFQTNTISAVKSNWTGTFYTVGSNTFAGVLQIINGGVLSNGSCVIGWTVGGSNNTAIVSGLNSAMSNRFEMYLGNNGAFNRLVITNRGLVSSGHGYLGFNSFGTQNVALVSDTGSVWRVKTNLFIGYADGANSLIVSNGGVVSDALGMIGSNANLNVVTITGPGSLWSNTVSLVTGFIGRNNRLTVTNGALAWSGFGYVGNGSTSSNNLAIVTGPGSTWRNTNSLFVGYFGSSNRLEVLDGGVVNGLSGYLGVDAVGSNNIAVVAGSGAVWSNALNLYVGFAGVGNRLVVTNGGKVWTQSGAMGWTNLSTGNSALIEGAGSTWTNATTLYVGTLASGNELVVSNGATLFSGNGYVGFNLVSSNNTATITGSNSVWASTNLIQIGYVGSSNRLFVINGARVLANETRIGFAPESTNSFALITGSGALLSNLTAIVGYGAYASQMIVSNGATVLDQNGAVGYTNQSSGNSAWITGSGSMWSNVQTYVGYKSANNQLVVAADGALLDADTHIGTFANASNNSAWVTGPGSRWLNTGYLHVGELASSNTLTIADGGLATAGLETRVGWDTLSSNNVLTVTGSGALLSNTVNTLVGVAGPLNRLVVSDNAGVWDQAGIVGYSNTTARNVGIVDGGVWSNTVNFQVGYKSSLNQLIVTNAGRIYSPDSFIGTFNIGSSNAAVVTGPGSRWVSTNNFYVGYDGRSNVLMIADGGGVFDVNGYIGYNATATTNFVLVTGPGATWTNTTLFYLGTFAPGNALTVSNGGTVYCGSDTILGYDAAGDKNSVLVTGTNSTWVNNRLYVGLSGASNSVTIANGGKGTILDGYNSFLYLGYNPASISNTVLVTEPGSSWLVAELRIGNASRSNSLTVANGGTVESLSGYVGHLTGTNNFALVTGPGSKWQNDQYLYVGYGGARNSLVVSNGGAVSAHFGSYIGYAFTAGVGVSNSVLIADAGSTWTNSGSMVVGYATRGNGVTISNGAVAYSASAASVGYAGTTGADGSNNFAVVTGNGSAWDNGGSFTVGDGAHSNRVTVAQAGKLTGQNIFVGARGGTNNFLRLTNGIVQATTVNVGTGNYLSGSGTVTGSLVNNGTIAADINGATLTFNSFVRNNGALRANGGGIIEFYGPVLNFGTTNFTGGTAIFHAGIFSSTGTTNSWIFASNGLWETDGRWSRGVAPSAADSLVLITNAATKTVTVSASASNNVNNFNIALSAPAGSTNTLRIADLPGPFVSLYLNVGTNAILMVSNATVQVGAFGVGDFRADGELRVEEGGFLDATAALTSTVANATITGIASNNLLLARNGLLKIAGTLYSANSILINSNVVAVVAGNGASLRAPGSVYVGYTGPGNQLSVTSGGALFTGNVSIGSATSASNNLLTLSDPGTTWTNSGALTFDGGANCQLSVSNGANVVNFGFITYLGGGAGDQNSSILITGTNTRWQDFSFAWQLGYLGAKNQVTIADGASFTLSGSSIAVGANFSASNNTLLATGSNTVCTASGFNIGTASPGNQLIVTNGATAVATLGCYMGGAPSAFNNVATVTGNDSLWRTPYLIVGQAGSSSNRVEITGGGVTSAGSLTIGVTGTGNIVHVNSGTLFVTNNVATAPLTVNNNLILDAGTVTVDKLIVTNPAGLVALNGGVMNSRSAFVTNEQQFVINNGGHYHLFGGVHNFNNGLVVRTNALLSGCGTINGTVVVDAGGTVIADCSSLVFTGSVTNNGTMRASNGNVLEFYGTVVNNGVIDLINGGVTNFHGAFINNGTVLDSASVVVSQASVAGDDFVLQVPSVVGHTYRLQITPTLESPSWMDAGATQNGTGGVLTFTDPGGATNQPSRIYRVRVSAP